MRVEHVTHLSETVDDADGRSDARAEHVTQQEVDAAALHAAALAHADGAEGGEKRHDDGDADDQYRQPDACVALYGAKRNESSRLPVCKTKQKPPNQRFIEIIN